MARNRRLDLLNRVERLRRVERLTAAQQAADAQGEHGQLLRLRDRSGALADDYARRRDASDGAGLRRQINFLAALGDLARQTEAETRRSESAARHALSQLALADRRLEITNDRILTERRADAREELSKQNAVNPGLARKLKRD